MAENTAPPTIDNNVNNQPTNHDQNPTAQNPDNPPPGQNPNNPQLQARTLEEIANLGKLNVNIASVAKNLQGPNGEGEHEEMLEYQAKKLARMKQQETREQRRGGGNWLHRTVSRIWKQSIFSIADYNKEKSIAMEQIAVAGVDVADLPHGFLQQLNNAALDTVQTRRRNHEGGSGNRITDFLHEATFTQKQLHREQTDMLRRLRATALMTAQERTNLSTAADNTLNPAQLELKRFLNGTDHGYANQGARQAQVNALVNEFSDIVTGNRQARDALAQRAGRDVASGAIREAVGERKLDTRQQVSAGLTRRITDTGITPYLQAYFDARAQGLTRIPTEVLNRLDEQLTDTLTTTQEGAAYIHAMRVAHGNVINESLTVANNLFSVLEKVAPQLYALYEHERSISNVQDYSRDIILGQFAQNVHLEATLAALRGGPQTNLGESLTERMTSRHINQQRVRDLLTNIRNGNPESMPLYPDAAREAASGRANILRSNGLIGAGATAAGNTIAAVGAGLGIYALQRAASSGANLLLPIVGGAAVRGAIAGVREYQQTAREQEIKYIEDALGYTSTPDMRRRNNLARMPIINMREGITNPLTQFVDLLQNDPNRVLTREELYGGLAHLSNFDGRQRVRNDMPNVELFGVGLNQNYEVELNAAQDARDNATRALRAYFDRQGADPAIATQFRELNTRLGVAPGSGSVETYVGALAGAQAEHLRRGEQVAEAYREVLGAVALPQMHLSVERQQERAHDEQITRAVMRGAAAGVMAGVGAEAVKLGTDAAVDAIHGAVEGFQHLIHPEVVTHVVSQHLENVQGTVIQEGNFNINIPPDWHDFKPEGKGFSVVIDEGGKHVTHHFHEGVFKGKLVIIDDKNEYILDINSQTVPVEQAIEMQYNPNLVHEISANDIHIQDHPLPPYARYDGVNYAGPLDAGHWNEMPGYDAQGHYTGWIKAPGATSYGRNIVGGPLDPRSPFIKDPNPQSWFSDKSKWITDPVTDKILHDSGITQISAGKMPEIADLPDGRHLIGIPDARGVIHWPPGTFQPGTVFRYGFFTEQQGDLTKYVDVTQGQHDFSHLIFQQVGSKPITPAEIPQGSTTVVSVNFEHIVNQTTTNPTPAEHFHADIPAYVPLPFSRRPLEAPEGDRRIRQPEPTPVPEPELEYEYDYYYENPTALREWLEQHPEAHHPYTRVVDPDGRVRWVDENGQEVRRDTDRERQRIRDYLDRVRTRDPQYYAQLESFANTQPMSERCQMSVNIPAWMEEGRLVKTLELYAGQTGTVTMPDGSVVDIATNPALWEINVIVNNKRGDATQRTASENTLRQIEAFQRAHPDLHINVVHVEFDEPSPARAREFITDLTLLRSLNRPTQVGSLYIESEDADLLNVDLHTVQNRIRKFTEEPYRDVVTGTLDYYPDEMMKNDLIFLRRRIGDFRAALFQYKRTPGVNTAFTAEAYAMVGGYDTSVTMGEDLIMGQRIAWARGDGQSANRDVIGEDGTRTDTSPRRIIGEVITGVGAYSSRAAFTDPRTNALIRTGQLEDLLERPEVKRYERINPGEPRNISRFQNVINEQMMFAHRMSSTQQGSERRREQLLFWVGFKKGDYRLRQDGSVEITNWANLQHALNDYRTRHESLATNPRRPGERTRHERPHESTRAKIARFNSEDHALPLPVDRQRPRFEFADVHVSPATLAILKAGGDASEVSSPNTGATYILRHNKEFGITVSQAKHTRVVAGYKEGSNEVLAFKIIPKTEQIDLARRHGFPTSYDDPEQFIVDRQNELGVSSNSLLLYQDKFEDGNGNIVHVYKPISMDLETYMQQPGNNTLSGKTTAEIGIRLLQGVQDLNVLGVAHLDIVPDNIFIDPDGNVFLGDFDAVSRRHKPGEVNKPGGPQNYFTRNSRGVGWPGFMPPEMLDPRGPQNITRSADVYEVGVLLYKMIKGNYPYEPGTGTHDNEQIREVRRAQTRGIASVDFASIPPALEAILRRSLDPDPARRYQTAGQMLRDLLDVYESDLSGAPLPSRHGASSRPGRAPGSGAPGSADHRSTVVPHVDLHAEMPAWPQDLRDEIKNLAIEIGDTTIDDATLDEFLSNSDRAKEIFTDFADRLFNGIPEPRRGYIDRQIGEAVDIFDTDFPGATAAEKAIITANKLKMLDALLRNIAKLDGPSATPGLRRDFNRWVQVWFARYEDKVDVDFDPNVVTMYARKEDIATATDARKLKSNYVSITNGRSSDNKRGVINLFASPSELEATVKSDLLREEVNVKSALVERLLTSIGEMVGSAPGEFNMGRFLLEGDDYAMEQYARLAGELFAGLPATDPVREIINDQLDILRNNRHESPLAPLGKRLSQEKQRQLELNRLELLQPILENLAVMHRTGSNYRADYARWVTKLATSSDYRIAIGIPEVVMDAYEDCEQLPQRGRNGFSTRSAVFITGSGRDVTAVVNLFARPTEILNFIAGLEPSIPASESAPTVEPPRTGIDVFRAPIPETRDALRAEVEQLIAELGLTNWNTENFLHDDDYAERYYTSIGKGLFYGIDVVSRDNMITELRRVRQIFRLPFAGNGNQEITDYNRLRLIDPILRNLVAFQRDPAFAAAYTAAIEEELNDPDNDSLTPEISQMIQWQYQNRQQIKGGPIFLFRDLPGKKGIDKRLNLLASPEQIADALSVTIPEPAPVVSPTTPPTPDRAPATVPAPEYHNPAEADKSVPAADSLMEERLAILAMLDEGRIDGPEADRLLKGLDGEISIPELRKLVKVRKAINRNKARAVIAVTKLLQSYGMDMENIKIFKNVLNLHDDDVALLERHYSLYLENQVSKNQEKIHDLFKPESKQSRQELAAYIHTIANAQRAGQYLDNFPTLHPNASLSETVHADIQHVEAVAGSEKQLAVLRTLKVTIGGIELDVMQAKDMLNEIKDNLPPDEESSSGGPTAPPTTPSPFSGAGFEAATPVSGTREGLSDEEISRVNNQLHELKSKYTDKFGDLPDSFEELITSQEKQRALIVVLLKETGLYNEHDADIAKSINAALFMLRPPDSSGRMLRHSQAFLSQTVTRLQQYAENPQLRDELVKIRTIIIANNMPFQLSISVNSTHLSPLSYSIGNTTEQRAYMDIDPFADPSYIQYSIHRGLLSRDELQRYFHFSDEDIDNLTRIYDTLQHEFPLPDSSGEDGAELNLNIRSLLHPESLREVEAVEQTIRQKYGVKNIEDMLDNELKKDIIEQLRIRYPALLRATVLRAMGITSEQINNLSNKDKIENLLGALDDVFENLWLDEHTSDKESSETAAVEAYTTSKKDIAEALGIQEDQLPLPDEIITKFFQAAEEKVLPNETVDGGSSEGTPSPANPAPSSPNDSSPPGAGLGSSPSTTPSPPSPGGAVAVSPAIDKAPEEAAAEGEEDIVNKAEMPVATEKAVETIIPLELFRQLRNISDEEIGKVLENQDTNLSEEQQAAIRKARAIIEGIVVESLKASLGVSGDDINAVKTPGNPKYSNYFDRLVIQLLMNSKDHTTLITAFMPANTSHTRVAQALGKRANNYKDFVDRFNTLVTQSVDVRQINDTYEVSIPGIEASGEPFVQEQEQKKDFGIYNVAEKTDPGIKRQHKQNEDSLVALHVATEIGENGTEIEGGNLFIVADGMGGHVNGKEASILAITTMQEKIKTLAQSLKVREEQLQRKLSHAEKREFIRTKIIEYVQEANKVIFEKNIEERVDMGTTFVAGFMFADGTGFVVNVGDSRAYVYQGGQLKPITQDHSVVASLVEAGIIKPEDIYTHPKRNQIYRSFGEKIPVEVDVFDIPSDTIQPLKKGDKLLLCSDGLWDMVGDKNPLQSGKRNIQEIIEQQKPANDIADELIQAAKDGGGEDNISVIVATVEETPNPIIESPEVAMPIVAPPAPVAQVEAPSVEVTRDMRADPRRIMSNENAVVETDPNVREIKRFISNGLYYLREAIERQDLAALKSAMAYFTNEAASEEAQKLGMVLKRSTPVGIGANVPDAYIRERINKMATRSAFHKDPGQQAQIIISGIFPMGDRNGVDLDFAYYHEVALINAEEWIHAMHYLKKFESMAGYKDPEHAAAAYLHENGIKLTKQFMERYNRDIAVELDNLEEYDLSKDSSYEGGQLELNNQVYTTYRLKTGELMNINRCLLNNKATTKKHNYGIVFKTQSGSVYTVDTNGVLSVRRPHSSQPVRVGVLVIPSRLHYMTIGQPAFLPYVDSNGQIGTVRITSRVEDAYVYASDTKPKPKLGIGRIYPAFTLLQSYTNPAN